MTTALNIAGALVLCLPLLILLAHERHVRRKAAALVADPNARIDARIASERHPARRATWRMIRNDELEGL